MAFSDCVTLSSDSSCSPSPRSNNEFEIPAEDCHMNSDFSPVRKKTNIFSLSDSESEHTVFSQVSAKISSSLADGNKTKVKRKRATKLPDEDKKKNKEMKSLQKQAVQEKKQYQRSLQPGECIKYVTAEIDEGVFQLQPMSDLKESLSAKQQKYVTVSHTVKGLVAWSRAVIGVEDPGEEERVMLCLSAEEVARLSDDGMLSSHVGSIRDFLLGKFITLVICGVEEYFRSSKNKKQHRVSRDIPVFTRKTFEESLVQLQLVYGIGHRMVENSFELASLIGMFTKAVAETPFKREKQDREGSGILNWFAKGDSKDCVRVDSSGNGCLLLWRQQLRQFNNVGLDIAEAIASNYPSPQALLKAYDGCVTVTDAQKLLQNIPVRRGCGPLSSTRKVGPELSRKIHTFFTSVNGSQFLSES